MNIKEIKELIEAVSQNGIAELEVERSGVRLRIKKEGNPVSVSSAPPATSSILPTIHHSSAVGSSSEKPTTPPEGHRAADEEELYVVRSPIVGTFYRSPSADAEPFVKMNDTVEPGRVLCIIEAMKLMNEIEAEVSGEVTKIYVENGEPVEFGQALFGIRPLKRA